ncbi:MAG: patatin-like phospholipase family protein [Patescibacteria group bacterium]
MANKIQKRKTIGLALGSGAFRGFAHIGVIRSLQKHNIPIDYLSGSSIGAWVAAYYAIFKDVNKLEQDLVAKPKDNLPLLFDLSWTGGFIGGQRFMTYLEQSLRHHNFSALKIPLQIVATDLITGQPYVFTTGDVARAVRASTSVPLVFKPVSYKNKLLVDGGLSNPVPGDLLKKMGADIIIGVNLYNKNEFIQKKFTMPNVVLRSTRIVMHNLSNIAIRSVDIAIEPDTSKYIKEGSIAKYFTREIADKMIRVGEKATDKMIPQIKALLK